MEPQAEQNEITTDTRDVLIAAGYNGETLDTAMEPKPALDTKAEIWDAMLRRYTLWMVILLVVCQLLTCKWRCKRRQVNLACQRCSVVTSSIPNPNGGLWGQG